MEKRPKNNIDFDLVVNELSAFIGSHPDTLNYLHNTTSIEVAEHIMNNGFRFEGYVEFTCDLISGYDPVEIRYFLQTRRRYGDYTIIIQIGDKIVDYYSEQLLNCQTHFSEVLSVDTFQGSDEEMIYTLPSQFIKGYLDQSTGKKKENPNFDPHKDLDLFHKNLEKFL